jgi:hypothetical protein
MEEFKRIKLNKRDVNGCPLDEFFTINGIEFEMIDDVKKYIIYHDKKQKFIDKLYKKEKITEDDYIHLNRWFYLHKFPYSEEEDIKAQELREKQRDESLKNIFGKEYLKLQGTM